MKGKIYETSEAIINVIRCEGNWLVDDLTYSVLNIELLIDIEVIVNYN